MRAYDPAGMALARTLLDNVAFAEDAYRCAEGAHALVLVTEWRLSARSTLAAFAIFW